MVGQSGNDATMEVTIELKKLRLPGELEFNFARFGGLDLDPCRVREASEGRDLPN
jgi:hypothetical protein